MKDEFDLIVIGSGAAGLAAALTAARRGAAVVVLEASHLIGGTTAASGALLWAPANRWQRAAGHDDSIADARAYVSRCLGARADDERWELFLRRINPVIEELLVGEAGLSFRVLHYPDSFGEWPEGRSSRHLVADPFALRRLGSWASRLRQPAIPGLGLMTPADVERIGWVNPTAPSKLARLIPRMMLNMALRRRAMGIGLVAAMLAACLKHRVEIRTSSRAIGLLRNGRAVAGVRAATDSSVRELRARRGVVLAAGGFAWDEAARREHLAGPYDLPQDPPTNCGDALRLANEAGAELRHLDEAWYLPSIRLARPYMGAAVGQPLTLDRMLPHQLWVNSGGERFVNEASQNAAEAFAIKDRSGRLLNYPAHSIFDRQHRDKYAIYGRYRARSPGPEELVTADTLEQLAERIGVPAAALIATVERFNDLARAGIDGDFGRGQGAYERYFTGSEGSLGTIERPPFYALPVISGGVGTKGGAMTDASACVLDHAGTPIPHFYAAGNASAAFNGPITVAAGCTIPPALVMGNAAALHALDLTADG